MATEWKSGGRLFNKLLFRADERYFTSINGDGFFSNFGSQNLKGRLKKSG